MCHSTPKEPILVKSQLIIPKRHSENLNHNNELHSPYPKNSSNEFLLKYFNNFFDKKLNKIFKKSSLNIENSC